MLGEVCCQVWHKIPFLKPHWTQIEQGSGIITSSTLPNENSMGSIVIPYPRLSLELAVNKHLNINFVMTANTLEELAAN